MDVAHNTTRTSCVYHLSEEIHPMAREIAWSTVIAYKTLGFVKFISSIVVVEKYIYIYMNSYFTLLISIRVAMVHAANMLTRGRKEYIYLTYLDVVDSLVADDLTTTEPDHQQP